MPLTLDKCGNLGGDVEMVAVVKELALRHPEDEFILAGRNSGEDPVSVGLPENVYNPWRYWGPELRKRINDLGLNKGGLTIPDQIKIRGIFDDLTLDMFKSLDGFVMWVGQHGTTNSPIPRIDGREALTKPQDWSLYYASFMLRGINAWREADPLNREEINLNADARNRHKMRDLKWPLRHPVLAQYTFGNNLKHERYDDGTRLFEEFVTAEASPQTAHWPRDWGSELGWEENGNIWKSTVRNVYSRLEINGLAPGTPFGDLISYNETYEGRSHFGLFINEARAIGVRPEMARLPILKRWVMPLNPHFIHGTWSDKAKKELFADFPNWNIQPAPWDQYYPKLHSVLATFTTPSSGSGWATAKPWEAFAGGTVCFFHPQYDDQNHILSDAPQDLQAWLRVNNPTQLRTRIDMLMKDKSAWLWLVRAQREHFDKAMADKQYIKMIEERLYR